ncbi:hypothetical protein NBM05_08365 [Rothia sp. AR01]|uniref:Uncharacterized protein n=1 Tax=Rothia santali TaxID=2949643 RepID=A0A9X2HAG1_9MICC|nr:hypothetical protein [Rothia santali]MCP3426014.1 hypothetical protein [Rothia santali]
MTITCTCEATITSPGRFLCGACETRLHAELGRVPEILEELDVEVTRQAVKAASPGAGGAEGAGYDLVASEIRQDITRILTGLERLVSGAVGPSVVVRRRVARIRHHLPAAVKNASITGYAYDLTEQLHRAVQKIDRHPERVTYGACHCGGPLIAHRGTEYVPCRYCGTAYRAEALEEVRREAVLDELSGQALRMRDLAAALEMMGHAVSPSTLYRWAAAGKLADQGGRTYLVDDALDLAEQVEMRAA